MCAVQTWQQGPGNPFETIVDFLCNTMGAHGQQVSTFYRISLMGFTGSRVWMDMDGYGKTDANGYGKRDSIEKN